MLALGKKAGSRRGHLESQRMTNATPFTIFPSAPRGITSHPHELFDAKEALETALRNTLKGEVRFDKGSRPRLLGYKVIAQDSGRQQVSRFEVSR